MKRFIAVLGFLLMAIAVLAGLYHIAVKRTEYRKAEQKHDILRVYTDMPSAMIQVLGDQFLKDTGIQLEIVPLTSDQILNDSLKTAQPADVIITAEETLQQLDISEKLQPYSSEETDTVLNMYKGKNDTWTGVWLNPAVFVVNHEYFITHPGFPYTWDQVMGRQLVRLSFTDFIASAESSDLLVSLTEHFGEDGAMSRLSDAGRHVVQYGKYLSTPARMVALNKADIGISGYNEALQVKNDGFPLNIVYPDDGSPWYLYGIGISSGSEHKDHAEQFVDWLLSTEENKKVLQDAGYYYVFTNDGNLPLDDRGQTYTPWELEKVFFREGRNSLRNKWVDQIRFQGDSNKT